MSSSVEGGFVVAGGAEGDAGAPGFVARALEAAEGAELADGSGASGASGTTDDAAAIAGALAVLVGRGRVCVASSRGPRAPGRTITYAAMPTAVAAIATATKGSALRPLGAGGAARA